MQRLLNANTFNSSTDEIASYPLPLPFIHWRTILSSWGMSATPQPSPLTSEARRKSPVCGGSRCTPSVLQILEPSICPGRGTCFHYLHLPRPGSYGFCDGASIVSDPHLFTQEVQWSFIIIWSYVKFENLCNVSVSLNI